MVRTNQALSRSSSIFKYRCQHNSGFIQWKCFSVFSLSNLIFRRYRTNFTETVRPLIGIGKTDNLVDGVSDRPCRYFFTLDRFGIIPTTIFERSTISGATLLSRKNTSREANGIHASSPFQTIHPSQPK